MSAKGQYQQDDEPHGQCLEGYETTEVAHYIHDMLGSLEAIASKCDMDAVAALLAQAQAEAGKHF
jgi:hypothetical protein